MTEYAKHGHQGRAAERAGMDRKTARKYLEAGKLPSQLEKERSWRTRPDPFAEDWSEIREILEAVPEIEAKVMLDHLIQLRPDRYQEGQLRTLQRRFKHWRATEGPPKRVFFPQVHRPGEAMQTDFTWATELGITIQGEPFEHLLCHPVLPYSNWEWATVCRSESLPALKKGVQDALFQLKAVPVFHQTDNSTAATHNLASGKREFNEGYIAFVKHFGMQPRTIAIGEKEQNGDTEASHGVLKRRLRQLLLLRGSSDFQSAEEYEGWVRDVVRQANTGRLEKLREELEAMRPLAMCRLPDYTEIGVRVSSWSTIRVRCNSYSVPSQLRGELVRVRLFDDHLEVFYGGQRQLSIERLLGKRRHRINYRHIIESLMRRPGAFERYRYKEDLFPSDVFRRAYDALHADLPCRQADIEYLRCLHLAAHTMEVEVEMALSLLLDAQSLPRADDVKALVAPEKPQVPDVSAAVVDLKSYDGLLVEMREMAS